MPEINKIAGFFRASVASTLFRDEEGVNRRESIK